MHRTLHVPQQELLSPNLSLLNPGSKIPPFWASLDLLFASVVAIFSCLGAEFVTSDSAHDGGAIEGVELGWQPPVRKSRESA